MNPPPETEAPAEALASPYEVPQFDPREKAPTIKFVWWSWHPLYPYWSKSCWDGDTIEEAQEVLNQPATSKMKIYHNKLIREGDGALTEVLDMPPVEMENWHMHAARYQEHGKERDAVPIGQQPRFPKP